MAEIVLIDYGAGNVYSVQRALAAVAGGREVVLSDDPQKIKNASHIVLPGVGAFDFCHEQLCAKPDALAALEAAVRTQGKPFLGICVGAQLLGERGLEWGESAGLGWLEGESAPLEAARRAGLPLPHMGWNSLSGCGGSGGGSGGGFGGGFKLFAPMEGRDVYFANSFALRGVCAENVAATCSYGEDFCAAVAKDNIVGTQFHPEKSQAVGLEFLSRFVAWSP